MADSLLNGFRALDLTNEMGFMCGKILASMGVDTIKVEKPGGDPARNIPPFIDNSEGPEQSLYWRAFNTNKKSITLDLESDQGKNLFKKLAAKSDFVIESFAPGYLDSLGLGYEDLSRINPRIIMTSITPFGSKGPYSMYKGSNLVTYAMSGVMDVTGDPDRAPVKEAVDVTYYEAGAHAALGTVIAHYHRELSGEGQQIDVSIQECSATRGSINIPVWEFDKRFLKRTGNKSLVGAGVPSRWIWPCKNGYIFWALRGGPVPMGTPGNQKLSTWLDEEGLENPFKKIECSKGLDMASQPKEVLDMFEELIGALFLGFTKEEITERAFKTGMQAWAVDTPAEVIENPQFNARNFWAKLDGSDDGLKYPRHFFLCSETENFINRPAPRIGEHNEDVYVKEMGLSETEVAELRDSKVI